MKINRTTYTIMAAIALFCSCVKPFSPAVTTVNVNVLVVEGFINTGGDTTKINLSHTVTIGNKNSSVPESGATVTVEDAAGNSYPIPETKTKGSYASKGALTIISGKQYRLRIKTAGGKTYLSDLVDAKAVPPIDSLGYINAPEQMKLYVNSHDDANQTHYYKYAFSEAWYFHSKYRQNYFLYNGKMIDITPSQEVYYCYGQDSSNNITINSTAALSKDLVYQFVVNPMPDTSWKLQMRYSILVSQQALTKEGYAFWTNLKKNTEQLGSIFDAQPSAIGGNIHNIANAVEPVIGFISAGTIQKKRIYINKADLPSNYVPGYPFGCFLEYGSTQGDPPPLYNCCLAGILHTPSIYRLNMIDDTIHPVLFRYTNFQCADCTVLGKLNPPAFWKP